MWDFKSHYLDEWDLKEYQQKQCFSKRKIRLLADFFNVHVSEWNLGKNEDGSWKYVEPEADNEPHPASISKHDFEQLFEVPPAQVAPMELLSSENTGKKRFMDVNVDIESFQNQL